MNWQEFEASFKELQKRKLALMRGKSDDYAGPDDRFANFKGMGAATLLSPEQTILVMIACKITRLANLLRSGNPPNNESIADSAIDMANYADLFAIYIEQEQTEETERPADVDAVTHKLSLADETETFDACQGSKVAHPLVQCSCGWKGSGADMIATTGRSSRGWIVTREPIELAGGDRINALGGARCPKCLTNVWGEEKKDITADIDPTLKGDGFVKAIYDRIDEEDSCSE